jgi:hypothetical protein
MVLSEILSTSFLFSIAIVIILVGGLFAYFNHRLGAQNHKISSMMGLVSTMAEEMQYFRSKLSGRVVQEEENCCKIPDADLIHIVPQFMGGSKESLIEVSDEEDSEDDLSEASDSESESESDDDDLSESDEESDDESDDEEQDSKVKSICIDLGNEIDINIGDEMGDEIEQEDTITISEIGNTKTINLTEDISSFEITSKSLENINDIDISIKLTNDYAEKDKVDYKKMSLNKLREVVVEKGVVVDASKLKKNDILKMLGAEQ